MAAAQNPEPQLLFAVLCTQLGMAKPEQVLSAAAAWMTDRGKSLATRLLENGVIDERQRQLLESLVSEAIRANEGDAAQALESLGGRKLLDQTFSGSLILEADGRVRQAGQEPAPASPLEREAAEDAGPLPRYDIRQEIGRGGQARVRVAFDRQIGREVAWKELRESASDSITQPAEMSRSEAARVRFLREARITGQLEHPNIVPVYELGYRDDKHPYYTMRLVKGQTLSARLSACRGLSDRLKLLGSVWDLCNAIAYAHSRGVIHRDIKPDNVVVGELGETVVLDWGLAKSREGEDVKGPRLREQLQALQQGSSAATVVGSALGTPSYMSPEQAEGDIEQIDERSDVWGLGAVLYQVLTGRPPHEGETPFEIVGLAMSEAVRPVLEVCPEAPRELASIADKALNRRKDRRYQSAREMAEDISAFMTGGRVMAYDYGSWELLRRFASRHRAALFAGGLALVVILVSLVFLALAYRRESQALQREQEARLLAHLSLSQALVSRAEVVFHKQQMLSARIYGAASLYYNPANPHGPSWTAGYASAHPQAWQALVQARSLIDQTRRRPIQALERVLRLGGQVTSLALGADGQLLAAVAFQKGIRVWSTADWQRRWSSPGHEFATYGVDFLADGQRLVSTGYRPSLATWKLGQPEPLFTIELPPPSVKFATVSPDGRLLAASHGKGEIYLWEADSGRLVKKFAAHQGAIWELVFTAADRLASASEDRSLCLWEVPSGRQLWRATGHSGRIYSLALSHDGRRLASASTDRTLRFWDTRSGRALGVIRDPVDAFYAVSWSPDDRYVAAGGVDAVVSLFDPRTGQRRISLVGHSDSLESIVFTADGKHMLSGADDGDIRVWLLQQPGPRRFLKHDNTVYCLAASPGGTQMATGTAGGEVEIWDTRPAGAGSRADRRLVKLDVPLSTLAYSPQGDLLAVAGREKVLRVWNMASGKIVRELRGHQGTIRSIAFSPDGKLLAGGTSSKSVCIWNLSSGKLVRTLEGVGTYVTAVTYSADGRRLFVAGGRPEITTWDSSTGRQLGSLRGHTTRVQALVLLPGGQVLASAGKEGALIAWDTSSGRQLWQLETAGAPLEWLAASRDGRWLAAATGKDTLLVWSMAERRLVASIPLPSGPGPLAFLEGRLRLAAASDKEVQLLDVDLQAADVDARRLLDESQRQAGLKLSGFDLVAPGRD
ncbi:MAG: hypothetical protein DRI34_10205 [Deltaproteobacteria bacterium]|nr:MAG: hypothetical protein DRI34_10205 [Deltaproteobacteria bacterium]